MFAEILKKEKKKKNYIRILITNTLRQMFFLVFTLVRGFLKNIIKKLLIFSYILDISACEIRVESKLESTSSESKYGLEKILNSKAREAEAQGTLIFLES